jgi:tetratricopeptide (TPR) repeat protein
MLCPHCQTTNSAASRFCSNCGSSLGDASASGVRPVSLLTAGDGSSARGSPSSASPEWREPTHGDTLPSPLSPSSPSPAQGGLRDAMLGTLPAGVVFANRYEIQEVIGRGGMGTVYKAHDRNLDETVALKLIRPDLLPHGSILDRFKHETRLARRLAHPNVIKVFDFNDSEGIVYLSMEYLEGKDLRTRIVDEGPLPIDEAIDIACQVSAGLSYAHASGVLHRDIKPHNVFITTDGRVKLLDFGLAKAVDSTQLSSTGQMLGTPLYMAPEQASPEKQVVPDHRADLYALGVVLYQMFTGMPPFQGASPVEVALAHINQAPQPPREIRPEIPPHVEAVILGLLAKDRNDRPADAAEVIPALRGESELRPSGELKGAPTGAGTGNVRAERRALELTYAPDGTSRLGPALATRAAKTRRTRIAWIAGVAAVLVAGGVVAALTYPRMSADERVERLFILADGYYEKGKLVEPRGRNALENYRAILKLQPLNRKAIDRIQEIFESLVKQTDDALDRAEKAGDAERGGPALSDASKWFADARELNPEDPDIVDLGKRIDHVTAAFAEHATQRTRVTKDLDQADKWVSEGQLVGPVGANALETYRRVLGDDPANARAKDGIATVARLLKREAQALAVNDPFLARERYQQARDAAPDDVEIARALDAVDKQVASIESGARKTAGVHDLLEDARAHIDAGKLVRPQGDSALDRFRQVLAMSPGQPEAEKGLADIAARLVQAARKDAGDGRLEVARQNLSDALEAQPSNAEARAELAKVGAEIQRIAEEEDRQQRVASALARADGLRRLGQVVEPENANALDAYRAVLDLDPLNGAAKDAIIAIREELAANARAERKAGRLEEARAAYGRALKAAPGDTALAHELAQLDREAELARAAQAANEKALKELLTQAEGYLLRNQLTLPPDHNALDTYRKVLATEPDNARALAGLGDVVKKLVALGDEQMAKGNTRAALGYYQKAVIKERGNDPSLDARIRDTQARIAREDQAAAAAASAPPSVSVVERGVTRAGEALDAGHATEAVTWLEEARGADPKDARVLAASSRIRDALLTRAAEAGTRGEWDEAIRILELANRAVPGDAVVASKLAHAQKGLAEQREKNPTPPANPPADSNEPKPETPKRDIPPTFIPTF